MAVPDTLPTTVREKVASFVGQGSSPVDLIVNFTEAVYAARDEAPKEALAIAASCAHLIQISGYHGRLDGRAAAMIPALRRDSGKRAAAGAPWPKAKDDPVSNAEFRQKRGAEAAPDLGLSGFLLQ